MRTCTEPSEEDGHKSLLAHLRHALCKVFPSLLKQLSEIERGKLIQAKDCAHLDSQGSHVWPVLKPHAHSLTMPWQGSESRLQTAEDNMVGSGFALISEARVPLSQSLTAIIISGSSADHVCDGKITEFLTEFKSTHSTSHVHECAYVREHL